MASTSLQDDSAVPPGPIVVGLPSIGDQLDSMEIALPSDVLLEPVVPTNGEIGALVNTVITPTDSTSTGACKHAEVDTILLDTPIRQLQSVLMN